MVLWSNASYVQLNKFQVAICEWLFSMERGLVLTPAVWGNQKLGPLTDAIGKYHHGLLWQNWNNIYIEYITIVRNSNVQNCFFCICFICIYT